MRNLIILIFVFFMLPANSFAEASEESLNQELYDSVRFDHVGLAQIRKCLKKGADPNWVKEYPNNEWEKKRSVLAKYVFTSCYFRDRKLKVEAYDAVMLLFEHGAKLQECDSTILFYPISTGAWHYIGLLLEKGADACSWPMEKIGKGYSYSPIELAVMNKRENIVQSLIQYGARRPDAELEKQLIFLETCLNGSTDDLSKLLVEGARINGYGKMKETALTNSIRIRANYNKEKTLFLIEKGADPNQVAYDGFQVTYPINTAINKTSSYCNPPVNLDSSFYSEIIDRMIAKMDSVEVQDEKGLTPLHFASMCNHLYATEVLLKAGASASIADKQGKKPLDYAKTTEMKEMLQKAMEDFTGDQSSP